MPDSASLPTTDRLLELIDAMAGQSVIMVADLVADRFISGSPKRISREAPVLILSFERETFTPGGGANAVANIASLGGEPLTLGVVGNDESGLRLLEALDRLGVTTAGILKRSDYKTPTKTRILSGAHHAIKQQIVRYDVEDRLELSTDELGRFDSQLEDWTGRARVAVMSDYGYGAVRPELVASIRKALADGGRLLCDSRYRLAEFRGIDGATPNEEEVEALLGQPIGDGQHNILDAGNRLLDLLAAQFLLITRGSFGMCLFDGNGTCSIPVHGTDQVADVTGAGDTVIGTVALASAAGASPLEASLLANYAGGVVVMKSGTASLTRRELSDAVISNPGPLGGLEWVKS